jgi:hypothetical protein
MEQLKEKDQAFAADPGRLERRVKTLVEKYFPRNITHPENLNSAANWIGKEMRAAGANVTFQPFDYRRWDFPKLDEVAGTKEGTWSYSPGLPIVGRYKNVIASYGPDTKDILVVGAHFDAHDELPGADDNASGVSAVMELADLLNGVPLKQRVELVTYALEEAPAFAYGSTVHAESLKEAGKRVQMLSMEMVGYFTDFPRSQDMPKMFKRFYPNVGGFICIAGNVRSRRLVRQVKRSMRKGGGVNPILPVESVIAPVRLTPMIGLSDNSSYWEQGFEAGIITDTSFFRNKNYHTKFDTPDTLNYDIMAQVANGTLQAVIDLAGK